MLALQYRLQYLGAETGIPKITLNIESAAAI
jgi:hypothetical protein